MARTSPGGDWANLFQDVARGRAERVSRSTRCLRENRQRLAVRMLSSLGVDVGFILRLAEDAGVHAVKGSPLAKNPQPAHAGREIRLPARCLPLKKSAFIRSDAEVSSTSASGSTKLATRTGPAARKRRWSAQYQMNPRPFAGSGRRARGRTAARSSRSAYLRSPSRRPQRMVTSPA